MTRTEFIAKVAPIAVQLRREGSPIIPSIRIAQALLETGGKIPEWNNLVGFKVGAGKTNAYWKGRRVSTKTWEVYDGVRYDNVTADWRAYDSIADCFRDQDLLFAGIRYTRVCQAMTPAAQAQALYNCGYATDPSYASKLTAIAAGFAQYDEEALEPMLDKGVATTVINTWMGPAYESAKAAGNTQQADYIHWLADQLRKAAGIPTD